MGHIIILPEYDQTPPLYIKGLGHPPGTGSSRGVHGRSISVDSARNVAIAGYRNPVAGAFPRHGMLAYYDKDQNLQWVKSYNPGSGESTQYGTTFDSSGNVTVCGLSGAGIGSASLLKFDSAGALVYQRRLKSAGNSTAWDVDTDPASGHVYVAMEDSSSRCVLLKVNGTTGANIWARSFFQGNAGACTGVAVGTDGTVFICGWSYDGIAGTSRAAAWVARLDSDGNLLWVRGLGNTGDHQFTQAIAVDSENDPVIVGYESDRAPEVAFAAKWNSVGGLQWQRRLVISSTTTRFYDVSVDSDDNFWCSGQTLAGNDNMIHMKLRGSDGISLLNRRVGGPSGGDDVGYGVAVDNKDAAYIAGKSGLATFIDGLETNNNEHLLWGKFAGDGTSLTTWQPVNTITYAGVATSNTAGPLTHYTSPPHTIATIGMTNVTTTYSIFTTFLLTDVTPVQN